MTNETRQESWLDDRIMVLPLSARGASDKKSLKHTIRAGQAALGLLCDYMVSGEGRPEIQAIPLDDALRGLRASKEGDAQEQDRIAKTLGQLSDMGVSHVLVCGSHDLLAACHATGPSVAAGAWAEMLYSEGLARIGNLPMFVQQKIAGQGSSVREPRH